MNLLGLLRPSEQLNFPGTQSRATGFAKNKYSLDPGENWITNGGTRRFCGISFQRLIRIVQDCSRLIVLFDARECVAFAVLRDLVLPLLRER